jgi:hypothetical protein
MYSEAKKQCNSEAEYCYCHDCRKIREAADLMLTEKGLQCRHCGGYNFDQASWVICPHDKISAVKCPRGGKGIIDNGSGFECIDRCFFRTL